MRGSEQLASTAVIAAFEKQVDWCEGVEAPFAASVLRVLVEEFGRIGWLADTIGTWPGEPVADALALRFAGAFHALVVAGRDPDLAACYPGGDGSANLRAALPAALVRHEAAIRAFLRSPPQTNEPGRSAVLLRGSLRIAARTGLPLRLLEIGASAGLNMTGIGTPTISADATGAIPPAPSGWSRRGRGISLRSTFRW